MAYLIDTDIIIYSLNGNKRVNDNFRSKETEPKAISVITYGELIFGAKKSKNIDKNTAIVQRISEIFPVISITRDIMDTFGSIKAKLQKSGKIITDMDLIIASTAINWNYTLVTNNTNHFKNIKGLHLENWST